jgi:hypothetical protein
MLGSARGNENQTLSLDFRMAGAAMRMAFIDRRAPVMQSDRPYYSPPASAQHEHPFEVAMSKLFSGNGSGALGAICR